MMGIAAADTYYVPIADFDYYVSSSAGTITGTSTLTASDVRIVEPTLTTQAYGIIDTSGIADDAEFSSAKFYFNANSYTATKGLTKPYIVWIYDYSINNYVVLGTGTWVSGLNTLVVSSSLYSKINKQGYTIIRITVPESPAGKSRSMSVNAYETSQATAMRLDVTVVTAVPPVIDDSSVVFLVNDLLGGLCNYSVSYNVSDADGDIDACFASTSQGSFIGEYAGGVCSVDIVMNQSSSQSINVSVNDSTGFQDDYFEFLGVGVDYAYDANASAVNTLSQQYFIKVYNITSYVGNLSNVSFQGAIGELVRNVSLTNASTYQDDLTAQIGDYLEEDAAFTISGSEFVADAAYNIVRGVTFNNTLTKALPQFLLSIPLTKYSSNSLAEKQDGVSWPDLNSSISSGVLTFNLSSLAAGSTQNYRYSYDAELITWNGSSQASYFNEGQNKHWSYAASYQLNFDMTGKTIQQTYDELLWPEFGSRIGNYSKSFINSSGGVVLDSWTDQSGSWLHSYSGTDLGYFVLGLDYFTGISGGNSNDYHRFVRNDSELNQTVNVSLSFDGVIDFSGRDEYVVSLYSLPKNAYKEFLITAVGGEVHANIELDPELSDYVLDYGVCSLNTFDCSRRVDMLEGERLIFFIRTAWPESFVDVLIENDYDWVRYVYFTGSGVEFPVDVQIKAFFKPAYFLSSHVKWISHTAASVFMFALLVLLLLGLAYVVFSHV